MTKATGTATNRLGAVKPVLAVLAVVGVLFAAALAVAARDDDRPAGDPAGSALGIIEDLFPPRALDGDDARAGGATCAQGDALVLARGATCRFTVPDGVQRVAVRRVSGSGRTTVTLSAPGGGLVQTLDTAIAGPDDGDPDAYRLALVDDPSAVDVRCAGPAVCQLVLEG